jgi:3-deoxy-D-arabino-heptulosonate 7-phosphate (DAHP) synthase
MGIQISSMMESNIGWLAAGAETVISEVYKASKDGSSDRRDEMAKSTENKASSKIVTRKTAGTNTSGQARTSVIERAPMAMENIEQVNSKETLAIAVE